MDSRDRKRMKNPSFRQSMSNAIRGMRCVWREERNVKIETGIGTLALGMCAFFRVDRSEWIAVLFCCMVVLSLECMNSALENAVDYAGTEIHELAGRAKDFAAGAVLVASIFSAITGLIIFLPYIMSMLKK